jgi:hypothetical protein
MQGAKVRLAIQHATLVRHALSNCVDVHKVVTEWLDTGNTSEVTTAQARDWANTHIYIDDSLLNKALRIIYAEGYTLGQDIGITAVTYAVVHKANKPVKPVQGDWKNWKPGNKAAANLLKPEKGLSRLMDSRGVTLAGIRGTTLDRIGTQLAYALQRGLPPKEIAPAIEGILAPLREKIANELGANIDNLLSDSERALNIAQTEMSRAVSVAAREQYQESNVEQVEWLVAEGCDDCQENADASPIGIDEVFPTGDTEPPAHPNCMCSLAPYVVDTQNNSDALSSDVEE